MTDLDPIQARADQENVHELHAQGWECLLDLATQAFEDRDTLLAEVGRLHSWSGLMSILDEHYADDIFPTLPGYGTRDPGSRIVSLIRHIDALRAEVERVEKLIDSISPLAHGHACELADDIRAALRGDQ